IAKYPVTNGEYKCFIEDGGYDTEAAWCADGWQWVTVEKRQFPLFCSDAKWNGANFPVVGISWYEADAYARWLSNKTGKQYCLPTEAQWEKAACGANGREYPWGDSIDENRCNYNECGLGRTSPLGMFPAGESPYGCMDMAGNVWEWGADWGNRDYYKTGPDKNPQGPGSGGSRVLRGGSCIRNFRHVRSAYRNWYEPSTSDSDTGLRLAAG
ncbi:MAG: formylglycine-generating enzyme family protein, partial [bacterium]|nr:formylglycine-generating enzyme family protein [bacterium]